MPSPARLYIGRLSPDVRQADLEELFKGYGKIVDLRLMGAFGFCEWEKPEDAEDVIKDFNGKTFMGERLIIEPAKEARPKGPPAAVAATEAAMAAYRLIVSNLPANTSWQDLKDIGREAGHVSYADIDPSRPDEGVLEYDNREDYERALDKVEGMELRGSNSSRPPKEASPAPRDRSPAPRRSAREDSREPPARGSRYESRSPPPRRERDYE
ncbi:hypothetical protein FA10DRAFT_625 [Acaromyces ingoldii]|uniref:RRM domain-containing protein n=1 Tax=Acaromyces ingoldii TaxID=215250 RepID=A0A316YX45_9BASI|nr:hypothetical protein FA10DRAFT_625 [Acaromyces ingoldii]PWN92633.1 hypothetical protein FA10DRAFT_625 [Acaromyces ingoldii]